MEEFDDLQKGRVRQLSSVRYFFDTDELSITPIGDVHYGSPECDVKRFLAVLELLKNNDDKIILMGDLLEAASRHSVGAGWVEQKITPQQQLDDLYTWLYPFKDRILLLLDGNHEERIYKHSGIDVSGTLAKMLGVPYGGYACFAYLKVGKQGYTVYAQHGSSGATMPHTKMNSVKKTATHTDADLYLYGHVHELGYDTVAKRYYDTRMKGIRKKYQTFVLTGSMLGYEGGYAERKNMYPSELGFATIKLSGSEKKIKVYV